MITNLPCDLPNANPHCLVACSGGLGFVEMMAGEAAVEFHTFAELLPCTPDEERALAWEPELSDPAPNATHEARVDDAIKGARDLYESTADAWPVTIWRWARGGFGFGFTVPEETDAILLIDGALMAFTDTREPRP